MTVMSTSRKDDHVNAAFKQYQTNPTDFESIRFIHHSIPKYNLSDINIETSILNHQLTTPFYINAMTGGSEWTAQVNKQLAMVAKEAQLMMATGSISAAIKDPKVAHSFQIARKVNPDGFLLANLGANHPLENAKKAVDLIDADAFQIHLNSPQEIVMPEGDREFREFEDHIGEIVHGLGVPVMIKEVGFGMSSETVQRLIDIGVSTVDVSGFGGTNFATIENSRREKEDFAFLGDWGQSTAVSLIDNYHLKDVVDLVASGGIKHPLQMTKAFALGAKAVGMSGEFLQRVLTKGVDDTVEQVHAWEEQLKLIMLMLNAPTIPDLLHTDLIFIDFPKEWAEQRHIDLSKFNTRSHHAH